MFSKIDSLLNLLTMYRVVLYSLTALSIISIIFAFLKILSLNPWILITSLTIILTSCFSSNYVFSKVFKVPANIESNFITAFILFFILSPVGDFKSYALLTLAGIFAMASKYLLIYRKKLIFNPAAFGSFVVGFLGLGASWWVGSEVLFIPMAAIAFLVLRKQRKFTMFFSFLAFALITMLVFGYFYKTPPLYTFKYAFTSWPILFLGSIMLTEPLTIPPTKNLQNIYGAIVGTITAYQFPILNFYITPEFALLVGNVFAFAVSPKWRLKLTLKRIQKLSPTTNEFIFDKPQGVTYKAGQYIEWTLPHKKQDARGMRRYFTISSSPTESVLSLGVKKYNPSSTYKKALFNLKVGETIYAGQLKGDFTLQSNSSQKLAFIAGGIGITPFRSMVKYLLDKGESMDIILIHSCASEDEFVFKNLFEEGKKIGVKTIYVDNSKNQHITSELIKKEVPDYTERIFYVSGSNLMVNSVRKILKNLGIKKIKTDYFAGL